MEFNNIIDKIKKYKEEAERFVPESPEQIEKFRIRYLGKKGILADLFSEFKNIPPASKKETGQLINDLKKFVVSKIEKLKIEEENKIQDKKIEKDLTLPSSHINIGSRHPISIVRNEIIDIFSRLGFYVSEGPEIEDDWHVFSALNFPEEHPARDMQDTFFLEQNPDILLRTHTSSVQVRVMETEKPPLRTISPGRVFRSEAISSRSHCIFHQVEVLYIDRNVSFSDLKQTLIYFAREMFGKDTEIRLRPSFFPFTEPSGELDISCNCSGKGCNLCKYTGWLEILGCGMVDPNVLSSCGIDNEKYTGFAFGMGIERIALLKYNIKDIRLYFENDIRFTGQFISAF